MHTHAYAIKRMHTHAYANIISQDREKKKQDITKQASSRKDRPAIQTNIMASPSPLLKFTQQASQALGILSQNRDQAAVSKSVQVSLAPLVTLISTPPFSSPGDVNYSKSEIVELHKHVQQISTTLKCILQAEQSFKTSLIKMAGTVNAPVNNMTDVAACAEFCKTIPHEQSKHFQKQMKTLRNNIAKRFQDEFKALQEQAVNDECSDVSDLSDDEDDDDDDDDDDNDSVYSDDTLPSNRGGKKRMSSSSSPKSANEKKKRRKKESSDRGDIHDTIMVRQGKGRLLLVRSKICKMIATEFLKRKEILDMCSDTMSEEDMLTAIQNIINYNGPDKEFRKTRLKIHRIIRNAENSNDDTADHLRHSIAKYGPIVSIGETAIQFHNKDSVSEVVQDIVDKVVNIQQEVQQVQQVQQDIEE